LSRLDLLLAEIEAPWREVSLRAGLDKATASVERLLGELRKGLEALRMVARIQIEAMPLVAGAAPVGMPSPLSAPMESTIAKEATAAAAAAAAATAAAIAATSEETEVHGASDRRRSAGGMLVRLLSGETSYAATPVSCGLPAAAASQPPASSHAILMRSMAEGWKGDWPETAETVEIATGGKDVHRPPSLELCVATPPQTPKRPPDCQVGALVREFKGLRQAMRTRAEQRSDDSACLRRIETCLLQIAASKRSPRSPKSPVATLPVFYSEFRRESRENRARLNGRQESRENRAMLNGLQDSIARIESRTASLREPSRGVRPRSTCVQSLGAPTMNSEVLKRSAMPSSRWHLHGLDSACSRKVVAL